MTCLERMLIAALTWTTCRRCCWHERAVSRWRGKL